MATSTSTAQGIRSINPRYSGGEGSRGPRSSFDADVPAGVDPEGQWRYANSDKYRRTGSTAAERAGSVAGYTPGYGRSSNQNGMGASSLTPRAQFNDLFTPHLTQQMDVARNGIPTVPVPAPAPAAPSTLPNSANPSAPTAPAPMPLPPSPGTMDQIPAPVAPPSPAIGSIGGRPLEQNVGTTGNVQRQVTGLPPGQTASASFVRGQNSPQNLATRTRKPVDPLAT